MKTKIKTLEGFKGVRIVLDGKHWYCTSPELGKVQITADNALRIFMTCTSYAGDIQNELFLLEANSKYHVLYPKHSEEYQIHINTTIHNTTHKEQYQNLEVGDCIFYLKNKKSLMYLGDAYILEYKNTNYFMENHIKKNTQIPKVLSAKFKMFCSESGQVYAIHKKYPNHDKLKMEFDFSSLGFDSSNINGKNPQEMLMNLMEDLEFKTVHCISTNAHLDVALWDLKKFSSEEIGYSKLLSNYTVEELLMNNTIHYTRHLIDDIAIIDAVYRTDHLWFEPRNVQGLKCDSFMANVKPKYITFYKM